MHPSAGLPRGAATAPFRLDGLTRDLYSRVVHGSRVSLYVGFVTVGFAIIIGSVLGALAGWFRGRSDNLIMRTMDVILSFPGLLLAIVIVTVLGPGLLNAQIAIGIVAIPIYARVMRASVLSIRERDFVTASLALGESSRGILARRIVPNAITPVIVQGTLGIGVAILEVAALSFIGLGAQPPTAEGFDDRARADADDDLAPDHLPGHRDRGDRPRLQPARRRAARCARPAPAPMTERHPGPRGGAATSDIDGVESLGARLDETVIEELLPARRGGRSGTRRATAPRDQGAADVVHTRDGAVRAVDGIDFSVDRGEIMGLVGESGCGKSVTSLSVLRLVARPDRSRAARSCSTGRTCSSCRRTPCATSAASGSR